MRPNLALVARQFVDVFLKLFSPRVAAFVAAFACESADFASRIGFALFTAFRPAVQAARIEDGRRRERSRPRQEIL
jgi:hypothetical protein